MSIDWITVAAQVVNFLILVWLLHRFLYGPITRAVTRREAEIKERLDEAAETQRAAEAEAQQLRLERRRLADQHDALMARAHEEAATLKRELEQQARAEADGLRKAWQQDAEDDRALFIANMRSTAEHQFLALTRAAINGLTGRSLEDALCARFAEQIQALPPQTVERLHQELADSGNQARIVASFTPSGQAKERIEAAVRSTLSSETALTFAADDRLPFGIDLVIGGQTVSWGLESYLARLEERLHADIDAHIGDGAREETA